jgi:hypothetical protein
LAKAAEERASRAVLLVHQFDTYLTKPELRARNDCDLVRFLTRLGLEDPERVLEGELVGPINVPGGGKFRNPPPLFVGKAVRRVPQKEG